MSAQMEAFISWFHDEGGVLDTSVISLTDIPGHGRGAIALRDISQGHVLFSLPRELTLSTRNSTLPTRMGTSWREFGLHRGWTGVILCMLWEEAQGPSSKWAGYLSILPTRFDTPMFWSEEDLRELKGTAVVDKIGKEEAEKDFYEKLIPAVQSRPDLFPPETTAANYTIDRYHMMGSRILSRSFHVSKWTREDGEEEDEENAEADTSMNSVSMDVDEQSPSTDNQGGEQSQQIEETAEIVEDEEDEEGEDPTDVAMVPMADMLNARYESENAKLFYEEHELKMITTKDIKAGDQIWNTYGDPPNSDLLRRYGHVDILPLLPPLQGEGNPGDLVEIPADLVSTVALVKHRPGDAQERVDWWLENTDDDVFVIRTDCQVPEELVSFVRLLLLSTAEWDKTKSKSKLPKPKVDLDVIDITTKVVQARLREYPTTVEEDEQLLKQTEELSANKKNAVLVRLGEKRILQGTLTELGGVRAKLAGSGPNRKRTGERSEKGGTGKRARR